MLGVLYYFSARDACSAIQDMCQCENGECIVSVTNPARIKHDYVMLYKVIGEEGLKKWFV